MEGSNVAVVRPPQQLQPKQRVNKLIKEVLTASHSNAAMTMDDKAMQLLQEYVQDVTKGVLQAAQLLAQSRKSNSIEESDVSLILAKKLHVEVAGHEIKQPLHSQTLRSQTASSQATAAQTTAAAQPKAEPEDQKEQKEQPQAKKRQKVAK